MKAILTIGVSGSGKTTWAEQFVKDSEEKWVNVNRDYIRLNLVSPGKTIKTYEFSRENESKVTEIQRVLIKEACINGENVIISDTNLNSVFRKEIKEFLNSLGYDVEYKEFPIDHREAISRNFTRGDSSIPQHVLENQFNQWHQYLGECK